MRLDLLKRVSRFTHIKKAMFFCGSGEGAEPALQGLASSLVEPSQYATLFTTMTLVESVGRLIAGPLMAYLLRIGRNIDGEPTGLIFLLSAVSPVMFPPYLH